MSTPSILDVARRHPAPGGDRAVVAQAFLHRVRDQARVLADLLPGVRMLQQQLDRVGAGVGRGLVRGDDAGHHHRVQVGVGHDLRQLLLLADAVLHPAVGVGVAAHLLEQLAGELPEVADRMRHRHLLLGPRPAPGVDGVRDRVLAQQVHVFLGDAEEVQGHGQRHLPEQLVDQVGAAGVDEAVDVLARQPPHHRLVMAQRLGRERLHQRPAARHVRRLVLVDQGAVEGEAVGREHRVGFLAGGRDLLQRDRRAEGDVVAEDRLDVGVARHHPVAELRAPEHRLLLARPAHVLRRVLLVAVAERVEVGGALADRAAGGREVRGGRPVDDRAADRAGCARGLPAHFALPPGAPRGTSGAPGWRRSCRCCA